MGRDDRKSNFSSNLKNSTLIIGGAYCGKSEFAQSLIDPEKPTTVIGTGILQDPIFERRVARLKASRPDHWHQVDVMDDIYNNMTTDPLFDQLLVDSINQWVANIVMGHCQSYADEQIIDLVMHQSELMCAHLRNSSQNIVMVSSEVGAGLAPPKAVARLFRMLVSRVNAMIARECTNVVLLTAGIPWAVKGEIPHIIMQSSIAKAT